MPIVISYQDVDALGTMAFEGARTGAAAQGRLQNRALGAQIEQSRDRTATQLQQISAREREAAASRQFTGQQNELDRQYQYDALAQENALYDAKFKAGLAEAEIKAQADLQSDLLGGISQKKRDERLHQQRLEQIDRTAAGRARTGGQLGPGGVPDKKYATQEAQQFGGLIPYNAQQGGHPSLVAESTERTLDTAQGLSMLPTDQLESYQSSDRVPAGWKPYVEAVLQSRNAIGGGAPQGAMPEGGGVPGQRSASLASGQGLANFEGLGDAEFNEIANDPVKAAEFFRRQGR